MNVGNNIGNNIGNNASDNAGKTNGRSAGRNERTYDAIVIGGGHNGLVAAAYLGRAGYQVLVLEKRKVLGGAATTEEVFPGFYADTGSFDASLFLPQVVAELNLRKHGLRFIESPVLAFAPQPDGQAVTLWRDPAHNADELARFSQKDADQYPYFQYWLARLAEILRATLTLPPPDPVDYRIPELFSWLKVGRELKRLGQTELMDFLRFLPMPVADLLDEWFESPVLKGLFGSMGVLGSSLGPSAVGTGYLFLYQLLGAPHGQLRSSRLVRGGMVQLADALAREAISRGVEIHCAAEVDEIILEGDRVAGVVLKDGTQYWGHAVLSNASPRQTFFELVGANLLEVRFVRELKNIRYRGSTARVILGLSDFPHFRATAKRRSDIMEGTLLSGHTVICPSLEYLERAHDDAKYGDLPRQPYLEIVVPTILDATPGPKGQHLMLINVQYVPYALREGTWEVERARLGAQVVALLESYAPGFQDLVQHCLVLAPPDLEERFGLPGGCLYHGEMSLDQLLFMRPVPGYANYRTPVQNLYLCGAGTHPGGGVTGAPGFNAAREVIKALGKR